MFEVILEYHFPNGVVHLSIRSNGGSFSSTRAAAATMFVERHSRDVSAMICRHLGFISADGMRRRSEIDHGLVGNLFLQKRHFQIRLSPKHRKQTHPGSHHRFRDYPPQVRFLEDIYPPSNIRSEDRLKPEVSDQISFVVSIHWTSWFPLMAVVTARQELHGKIPGKVVEN